MLEEDLQSSLKEIDNPMKLIHANATPLPLHYPARAEGTRRGMIDQEKKTASAGCWG